MTTPTKMWQKLTRRMGRDRNPLRRRSDVIDAWLVPAAIVAFLALCPLVLTVTGSWMRAAAASQLQAQASWHSVQAVLLQPVAGPEQASHGVNSWLSWSRAQWTTDGVQRTASVPAPSGTRAGSKVTVWLDPAGNVHTPPLTASAASDRVVVGRVMALIALAVLLTIMVILARRMLDRRRLAGWEHAWLSVGPTWSKHR